MATTPTTFAATLPATMTTAATAGVAAIRARFLVPPADSAMATAIAASSVSDAVGSLSATAEAGTITILEHAAAIEDIEGNASATALEAIWRQIAALTAQVNFLVAVQGRWPTVR